MMKKLTLLLIIGFFSAQLNAQTFISYDMVSKTPVLLAGSFDLYVAKDGKEYKRNDILFFGEGSSENGDFLYIDFFNLMKTEYPVTKEDNNAAHQMKKIYVKGDEHSGFYASIKVKGKGGFYWVKLEEALENAEVKK